SSGPLVGISQVAYNTVPCAAEFGVGANNNNVPFYDTCPFLSAALGEGHARSGAVVASGRIFWQVSGQATASALGAIGPTNGGTTLTLATATPSPVVGSIPSATPVPTTTLTNYVWAAPQRPVPNIATDLQQKLQTEVGKILAAKQHLMPFYL